MGIGGIGAHAPPHASYIHGPSSPLPILQPRPAHALCPPGGACAGQSTPAPGLPRINMERMNGIPGSKSGAQWPRARSEVDAVACHQAARWLSQGSQWRGALVALLTDALRASFGHGDALGSSPWGFPGETVYEDQGLPIAHAGSIALTEAPLPAGT
jgi:hypothetical protein